MAKKRRSLRGAVSRFGEDLRIVTQQLNDGVNSLTRASQHKPCIAPQEFREALSSLQDDVTEITKEVETLESFTVDAISFEELLGHCLALYQANRNTIQLLELHLQQYGYHPPPGVEHEPENPITAAALAAANAPRLADREAGALGGGDDDGGTDTDIDMDHLADLSFSGLLPMDSQSAVDATQDTGAGPFTGSRAIGRYGAVKEGPIGTEMAASRGYGAAFRAEDGRRDNSRKATSDKAPSEDEHDRGAGGPDRHRAGAGSSMGFFGCDKHGTHSRLQPHQHQFHGLSARATGRKAAPRPSVDSRASSTPDFMLLSPSVHELLAKYNPPNGSDHGSLPPSASRLASVEPPGPAGSTPDTAEVVAVIQKGLASHSVRPGVRVEQNAEPGALPVSPQLGLGLGCSAAPGMGHTTASARVVKSTEQAQQQQVQQGFLGRRVPAVEEDTCALYQQLIRSSHVPGSLEPGQLAQPRAQPQPPPQRYQQLHQQTVAALRLSQPSAAPHVSQQHQPHSRIPSQQSPRAPPAAARPAGAELEEAAAPDGVTPRAARSKTPLSVLRANRQQHDKQLAEKLAGLEETLAGLTPLRRSCAGGLMRASIGGAAVTAANAAALELAKSPGPSRAAVEAAALANRLAGLSEATTAAGPAAATSMVMGAGAAGVGTAYTEQRVLSPLQPKALAGMLDTPPSMRGVSGTRNSCLPAHPGAAVAATTAASGAVAGAPAAAPPCSTVVGATTRGCAATGGAAAATPKPMPRGTPGRPKRGTPGRVPQPYMSPQGADEELGTVGRGMEAVTPRAAGRVAITPRAGGEAGTARATPHRKSIAGAFASTANAAAAAADVMAPTPGRASRIAVQSAAQAAVGLVGAPGGGVAGCGGVGAGGAIRTPGRIRCREAQENTFYPPHPESKPATQALALAVRVPQLRLEACIPTAPRQSDDSDWLGFPLSRRTPGRDGCGAATAHADAMDVDPRYPTAAVSFGAADEPTLAMPPSVSRSGTPTVRTPEQGQFCATPTGGGGADTSAVVGAVGAVVVAASSTACTAATGGGGAVGGVSAGMAMLSLSALEGLSPGTSQLVSRAMGEGFADHLRPAGMSRIPAPAPAPSSKPASAVPSATYTNTTTAGQLYGSSASGGGALSSYRPAATKTATVPPSLTVAAAAPLPSDFEPVSEEEWRGLAPRTQQAFPLKALNDHLRALAKTVASRPAPQEGCFSVADLEAMSLSTMASKLLVNVLVKLGRCRVAAGAVGAGMLYRLEL